MYGFFNRQEIVGIARVVRHDYKQPSAEKVDTIMNFIVEPTDKKIGNITVEMRGTTIEGDISDRDVIKVRGEPKDGVIKVNNLTNVTTNSTINSREYREKLNVIVEGIARSVRKSKHGYGTSILDFRTESTDKEGNTIKVTPVEIHDWIIYGDIVDGDSVKVKGKMENGLVRANEAINITTNSFVKTYNKNVRKLFSEKANRVHGEMTVEGVARAANRDNQMYHENPYPYRPIHYIILNLRIQCYDKEGNETKIVPVEMRGANIRGDVVDGDSIKVTGKIVDGVMIAKQAWNNKTNSCVQVQDWK